MSLPHRIDAISCRLSLTSGYELGLLCLYRPPNSDSNDNDVMLNIINRFLNLNYKSNIIMGDFNFPDICWPFCANLPEFFLNFCHENLLTQHVYVPTRRVSNVVLDLILSTCGTEVSDLTVNEEMSSSDHSVISFAVSAEHYIKRKKLRRRNMKNVNWALFQELLLPAPEWDVVLASKNIDIIWIYFLNVLISALDVVAPYKDFAPRSLRSSARVRTALRIKRRRYHNLVNEPYSNRNRLLYERSCIIADKVINDDLHKIENRIIDTNDPRVFWSFVNRRMNSHHDIQHILQDDNVIFDKNLIANSFNEYFASVFSASSSDSVVNSITDKLTKPISSSPDSRYISISDHDVMKLLNKLPNKSSTDADGISYYILKKGGLSIAFYLSQLFSLSLKTYSLPAAWKMAVVSPIFKSGSRASVATYRPVSVTSCCSRVLERYIKDILNDFLLERGTLYDSQHGFLRGRSTDTLLLKFYDDVT